MKEDLNKYKSAYRSEFKFYQENIWYLRHYSKLMCSSIRDQKLERVLSLGLGHEVVVNAFQKEFDHTVKKHLILDGALELINDFKQSNPDCSSNFKHTYFEEFETDERYEAIEMGFVLEHVDNPLLILTHYKQFLSPDGTIYIAVPNAKSLHRLIGHRAGLLDDMYTLSSQDHELGHKRYFDLELMKSLIGEAGLAIVSIKGLMLKPVTGAQIEKLEWDENIIEALFDIGEDYPEIANCMYFEVKQAQ